MDSPSALSTRVAVERDRESATNMDTPSALSTREFGPTGRREFLKRAAAAGISASLGVAGAEAGLPAGWAVAQDGRRDLGPAPDEPFAAPKLERVRIGFVGVGGMGTWHVTNLLKVEGVEIKAVCDIREEHARRAADMVEKAGQKPPALYTRGERDFERLCQTEELDLVFTATPWEWHVPVCVAAMKAGKHAATEVPAATTIDECWQLVEHAEKHRKHCVMMENCCYDRPELMVLNMVRRGVFGEPMHAEVGYQHDLRALKFSNSGEGLWRRAHSIRRNANLYPTHGLGPAAQAMDINRGDQFDYLVSMSGPSRGLQLFQETLPADDPRRKETYLLGDVNLALIRTRAGRTIYLVHDTNLPRPYARYNLFQGTKAIYVGFPSRFYVEGRGKEHAWEPLDELASEFEHPLWKSEKIRNMSGGHGGMDYLEDYRLIQCLRNGLPTDMDVYDAAAWSCITELTERSVAERSRAVDAPDFTRGQWKKRKPLGVVEA